MNAMNSPIVTYVYTYAEPVLGTCSQRIVNLKKKDIEKEIRFTLAPNSA